MDRTEKPDGLQSMGLQKVGHDLAPEQACLLIDWGNRKQLKEANEFSASVNSCGLKDFRDSLADKAYEKSGGVRAGFEKQDACQVMELLLLIC